MRVRFQHINTFQRECAPSDLYWVLSFIIFSLDCVDDEWTRWISARVYVHCTQMYQMRACMHVCNIHCVSKYSMSVSGFFATLCQLKPCERNRISYHITHLYHEWARLTVLVVVSYSVHCTVPFRMLLFFAAQLSCNSYTHAKMGTNASFWCPAAISYRCVFCVFMCVRFQLYFGLVHAWE